MADELPQFPTRIDSFLEATEKYVRFYEYARICESGLPAAVGNEPAAIFREVHRTVGELKDQGASIRDAALPLAEELRAAGRVESAAFVLRIRDCAGGVEGAKTLLTFWPEAKANLQETAMESRLMVKADCVAIQGGPATPAPAPDGEVAKARRNTPAKRANRTSIELKGEPSQYVPPPDDSRRVISTVSSGEMVWVNYESVRPSDVRAYWRETERQVSKIQAELEAQSGNPHVDPFPYYVGRDALQLLEAVMQELEAAASGVFDKRDCYSFLQVYMARLKVLTDELSFCLEAWATPRPPSSPLKKST